MEHKSRKEALCRRAIFFLIAKLSSESTKSWGNTPSWFCDDCLHKRIAFYSILTILGCLLVSLLSLTILIPNALVIVFVPAFAGVMLMSVAGARLLKGSKDLGDRMAIELNRHKKEFHALFTRKECEKR